MNVTVCQLRNQPEELAADWERLTEHVQQSKSDLVLLPEMPFHPWLAANPRANPSAWQTAVYHHEQWLSRFPDLGTAVLLSSRPIIQNGKHLNQGYLWQQAAGLLPVHLKYYLPDEEGYWEASWYERGNGRFEPIQYHQLKVGFMICTDMWFMQHASAYGQAGIHILAVPRATPHETISKWQAGGQAAAIISGAFCLSSNLYSEPTTAVNLGGCGWIIDPDGRVLATTSPEQPFITLALDLQIAEAAKQTYPRYVKR